MTHQEILKEARQLLIDKGWIKGASSDEAGRHCLSGAIHAVAEGHGTPSPAPFGCPCYDIADVLDGRRTAISFNDDPTTEFVDVLRVIDLTIAKLDEAAA